MNLISDLHYAIDCAIYQAACTKKRRPRIPEPKSKVLSRGKTFVKTQKKFYYRLNSKFKICVKNALLTSIAWWDFGNKFMDKFGYLNTPMNGIKLLRYDAMTYPNSIHKLHHLCIKKAFITGLYSSKKTAITRFSNNIYFDFNLISLILSFISKTDFVILRL